MLLRTDSNDTPCVLSGKLALIRSISACATALATLSNSARLASFACLLRSRVSSMIKFSRFAMSLLYLSKLV